MCPRIITKGESITWAKYHGIEPFGSITAREPIYNPTMKVIVNEKNIINACFFLFIAKCPAPGTTQPSRPTINKNIILLGFDCNVIIIVRLDDLTNLFD